jgi:hypothetical protein
VPCCEANSHGTVLYERIIDGDRVQMVLEARLKTIMGEHTQREVPLKVGKLAEAEADLDVAVRGFEEQVHDMVCLLPLTPV